MTDAQNTTAAPADDGVLREMLRYMFHKCHQSFFASVANADQVMRFIHAREAALRQENAALAEHLAAARRERDEARTTLTALQARKFPIMGGPSIPWPLIAPFEKQAFDNHGQSLERLAQRGGLDMGEAVAIMTSKRWCDVVQPSVDDFLRFIAARAALTAQAEGGRLAATQEGKRHG